MTDTTEIIPGKDTRIVLDELYYTVTGAMKKLNVGRNKIVNSVKDGTLTVFIHPSGNLFSEGSLLTWVKKHTVTMKK
ncbi:MAG: hypothetical protein IKB97_09280 [Bacteroidaceae bacterium]|nr:hypothetical protein [Bacteroidaceae bacterium]